MLRRLTVEGKTVVVFVVEVDRPSRFFRQSRVIELEENHDKKNLASYAEGIVSIGECPPAASVAPDCCIVVSKEMQPAFVGLGPDYNPVDGHSCPLKTY
jgi:hypothetical protein